MIGDGRIDMHRIDVAVLDQLIKAGVAFGHAELIADALEAFRIALADGIHLRIRMLLKNLNEFRPESKPNDSNPDLAHGGSLLFQLTDQMRRVVTDVSGRW